MKCLGDWLIMTSFSLFSWLGTNSHVSASLELSSMWFLVFFPVTSPMTCSSQANEMMVPCDFHVFFFFSGRGVGYFPPGITSPGELKISTGETALGARAFWAPTATSHKGHGRAQSSQQGRRGGGRFRQYMYMYMIYIYIYIYMYITYINIYIYIYINHDELCPMYCSISVCFLLGTDGQVGRQKDIPFDSFWWNVTNRFGHPTTSGKKSEILNVQLQLFKPSIFRIYIVGM